MRSSSASSPRTTATTCATSHRSNHGPGRDRSGAVSTFLTFTIVGIVPGATSAAAPPGLLVASPPSGIFNSARGARGMFMAFPYGEPRAHRHWPAPVALIVVLFILSPLL